MKENEVIWLAKHGTFNGQPLDGEIEETHISWVILCQNVVFKIKKPLKLSFLDFSTLVKRKRNCEREVRLNRRFTDIYQGVVAIRLLGSKFTLGEGNGKIKDYAVQLKRLATNRRMDNLLITNQVRNDDIKRLAKTISEAHKRCPVKRVAFDLSKAKKLFNDIHQETKFITENVGSRYGDIVQKCIKSSNNFLTTHEQRLKERMQRGFIRDVHGDLHSGNIFIYRTPVVFDCIEFNDSFRQIDVLYEIAFLCMDLEKYHKKHFANILFSEYNKRLKCIVTPEDRIIFNYYKGLRANIRAKVHALGVRQAENDNEFRFHLKELKIYLELMDKYMTP